MKLLCIATPHPLGAPDMVAYVQAKDDAAVAAILKGGIEQGLLTAPVKYKVCDLPDDWSLHDVEMLLDQGVTFDPDTNLYTVSTRP